DRADINIYRGLYWREPVLAVILTIMMLSLAGIPTTLGFIGKFYIIITAINAKLWLLITIVIIGNMISLYYYLYFIASLYSYDKIENNQFNKKLNINLATLFVLFCAVIIILFGVWPQPLLKIAAIALLAA
ncbi:MAG: proton-conducting transporter transmembrane domain-containing protein, partial [Arsenophonus sp. ET-DL12-MAG3]